MNREISNEQEGPYYDLSTEPTGTTSISGLEKIEPLEGGLTVIDKLNETIDKVNRIIDYLNQGVKK